MSRVKGAVPGCRHPKDQREKAPPDSVRCTACGATWVPRDTPARHGTYRGYGQHAYRRKGQWRWPACDKCKAAAREWRRVYDLRSADKRARREAARTAAFARMQRMYPGTYLRFYSEELAARETRLERRRPEPPLWDDVIARLVKEALGVDEASVVTKIRTRSATPREAEVLRQVTRLRAILGART